MATDAVTGTEHAAPSGGQDAARRSLAPPPLSIDYRLWKLMGWGGPVFMASFVFLWGVLAGNIPPFKPSATPLEVKAHYLDHQLAIMIGMSVCLTITATYMVWGVAISQVMQRIEGDAGMLSKLEVMGATITCAPIMTACAIWLTAAHEAATLSPEVLHMMYWLGWLLIDLAYLVTSFEIAACSIVFLRDKREKPLVAHWVSWWGWVTFASFFVVNAIPFVTTGPLAFNGIISFWIAFFTWFIWCPSLSYYVIKAVGRLKAEDEAAALAAG
ncbi:MAG TPA: hypothetical protein VGM60_18725 [Pseudonocardia sp.]|uniref:hypothetical protein n=1 Tax=Pseudonocardia sp. TaxID=60912 RepID=UPI002F42C6C9